MLIYVIQLKNIQWISNIILRCLNYHSTVCKYNMNDNKMNKLVCKSLISTVICSYVPLLTPVNVANSLNFLKIISQKETEWIWKDMHWTLFQCYSVPTMGWFKIHVPQIWISTVKKYFQNCIHKKWQHSLNLIQYNSYSNMTLFFHFVNKWVIYQLDIIALDHASVHVTDFPVINVHVDELSSARIWHHK